jgi:hypothetical protein
MVYFALALFADENDEEVPTRLTETLASWGCLDRSWATPTSGGLTQARKRLGPEPLKLLLDRVAVPVAGLLTREAFLRGWPLMAIDGFELEVPHTPANAAAFGYPAGGRERPAFPKVRVVTIAECGSHAKVATQMGPVGGKGSSEQALAHWRPRRSWPRPTASGGRRKRPADTGTRYHSPPTSGWSTCRHNHDQLTLSGIDPGPGDHSPGFGACRG